MNIIKREVLEQTAKIIGNQSAAAQALAEADKYDNPVFLSDMGTIIVTDQKIVDDILEEIKKNA